MNKLSLYGLNRLDPSLFVKQKAFEKLSTLFTKRRPTPCGKEKERQLAKGAFVDAFQKGVVHIGISLLSLLHLDDTSTKLLLVCQRHFLFAWQIWTSQNDFVGFSATLSYV